MNAHHKTESGDVRAAIGAALARVEAIVTQETALLGENRVVDLAEFNHRKRHVLLELNRILRHSGAGPRAMNADAIRLVALLEENQRMLARHLQAVDEIATLLARAIQEAESDGTYGPNG
jgi:hypothetical protein